MKTVKKLVSLIVIACLLGGMAVAFSGCGLATRTAGTVDGEDIPAGMYIYFLHSAIFSLEQQYQYGQLSSEYSDSSDESSAESSLPESSEPESSEPASSEEASTESSSTESSSEDNKPATLWDAIVENKTAKDYVIDKAYEKGMKIVMNPSPFNDRLRSCDLGKVSLFFVNEIEAAQITGNSDPDHALDALHKAYQRYLSFFLQRKGIFQAGRILQPPAYLLL